MASVLSDTSRPKSEVNSFFVRQWGDSFVPKNSIKDSAPSIPKVNSQQFSNYLATTAKVLYAFLKDLTIYKIESSKVCEGKKVTSKGANPAF